MQTFLAPAYLQTEQGREADRILRNCVHCGFCTATCPTFLLTGNELDSPRGRIYLIKAVLEGAAVSTVTQSHLDRCLSCQSCETTCPSGVDYHRLLDIGRLQVEQQLGRTLAVSLQRFFMRKLFTGVRLFPLALLLGRLFRPVLPASLKKMIPARQPAGNWPRQKRERRMLLLNGCVQRSLSPNTNAAAARVLDRLGIQAFAIRGEGCCGAVNYHLNAQEEGLVQARHNIDLLYEQLEQGVEAIVSTASGCGNFSKDYVKLFQHDKDYAEKANRVVASLKDISEILLAEDLTIFKPDKTAKLAFHSPCSLQHGHKLGGTVETILATVGFTLTPVVDAHLCCGSAGTYSILQPQLAQHLQANKIAALEAGAPDAIATANIGCQSHLGAVSRRPVRHWIEYLDDALA